MTDRLHGEISAFLDAYFAAWNRYDVAAMRALWDTDDPAPVYIAEECDPHIGWDAILGYWGVDRSKSERLVSWRSVVVNQGAPDVAVVLIEANWSTYIPGSRLYPKPFGGPVRISAALRRKDGAWKLFHYVEAPLASIVQLRRAHEDAVEPELHARLAAKGITY